MTHSTRHIRCAADWGMALGADFDHEVQRYWSIMDPVDRWKMARDTGLDTLTKFRESCRKVSHGIRYQRSWDFHHPGERL